MLGTLKREAGEKPARSRHRDSGACGLYPLGDREGSRGRLTDQPGDLPFGYRERKAPCHEVLTVRKFAGGIVSPLFAM